MGNKITSITFQHITGNIPKDDIAQSEIDLKDISLKERHQGLVIKFLPNTKENNNNFTADIDDDSLDSPTEEVETLISGNKTDETNDREVIINNSKKYAYTCITFF